MTTESMASIVVLGAYLFFVNRFLNRKNLRFSTRVLLNLLALFFITSVLDYFLFGTPFQSWKPLLQVIGILP